MSHGKRLGIGFNSFVLLGLLGTVVAVAWGAEREREGRGNRTSRTLYKEMPPAATEKVSYQKDVRPILMENCTRCHGSKKHKGDLRLDTPEGIHSGSEDGPVIKAGKSAESMLIRSVTGINVESDKVMPPKDDLLTKEEIGILRAWIDQGTPVDGK